jgi:Tfp pilus assembly protein PilN
VLVVTLSESPNPEDKKRAKPIISPRVILWMVIASLVGLFLPVYLVLGTIRDQNLSSQNELTQIQETLERDLPLDPTSQVWQESLDQARDQVATIQPIQSTLIAGHTNWPMTMTTIGSYDQSQLTLESITQTDNRLVLTGRAGDELAATTYSHQLEQSGLFSRVIVQSITLNHVPTPTPMPTVQASNSTPVPAGEAVLNPGSPGTFVEFVIMVEMKVTQP